MHGTGFFNAPGTRRVSKDEPQVRQLRQHFLSFTLCSCNCCRQTAEDPRSGERSYSNTPNHW